VLPFVSYKEYEKVYSWPIERFAEVLEHVCARHTLPRSVWRRFPLGRNLVFALGEAFTLKLVPPFWAHDAAREAAALGIVHGRLSVDTPKLIASGNLNDEGGWAYLVTHFMRGRQIGWAFGDLSETERVTLARQQGALSAELRALSLSKKEQTHLAFDWSTLLAEQRAGLIRELTAKGIPKTLVETAKAYVDEAGDLAAGIPG
jgi:hygromycin-B 7''-O-kinase